MTIARAGDSNSVWPNPKAHGATFCGKSIIMSPIPSPTLIPLGCGSEASHGTNLYYFRLRIFFSVQALYLHDVFEIDKLSLIPFFNIMNSLLFCS